MKDIFHEISIEVSKSSAHIVALVASPAYELLELGNDGVVGSVALKVYAESVVSLLSSVQGEDHVVHLLVTEVDDIVSYADAVGGKGEPYVLSGFLLDGSSILYQLLYDFPVHQGLTAEEVYVEILVVA